MNKEITFTKDLEFNTRIGEINTISLEDDLKYIDESIDGNLYVSGKYKILDGSMLLEDFSFSIPCSIDIALNLDNDSVKFNISNFTYEVIDNKILRCNISIIVSGDIKHRECDNDDVPEFLKEIPVKERDSEVNITNSNIEKETEEESNDNKNIIETSSIFATLDDNNFSTYRVYIMRENDSLDDVIKKYNTNKETLALYNDLDNIRVNSSIIIPDDESK